MRTVLLAVLVTAALAAPSTAVAKVRLVKVTSPVRAGSFAVLTAAVSPNAKCSIKVSYKSGPSRAQGLSPKRSVGGRVSWRWKVGTRTTSGRWPILVSCGRSGSLRTSFLVR